MSRYDEPSSLMLEIGAKVYPRRYHRFKDLRVSWEASEWAERLDWRNNPYDRFLLRRESLHYLEATEFYRGSENIFNYASREEIAAEVDRSMNEFPDQFKRGIFNYILMKVRWGLAFKHRRIIKTKLSVALAKLPEKKRT